MESLYLNLDFKYILRDKTIPLTFETNNGLWHSNFSGLLLNYQIIENYSGIQQLLYKLNQNDGINTISAKPPSFDSPIITLNFNGNKDFINYARNLILKQYNQINFKIVELTSLQMKKISKMFLNQLTRLSNNYQVEVLIDSTHNQLQLIGSQDIITKLETEIRILIDTELNGYLVECVEVNLSLVPILGGQNLLNFNEIAKQLNANIYLPDLLPELFNSNIYNDLNDFKIWITGSRMIEILQTKKILTNLIRATIEKGIEGSGTGTTSGNILSKSIEISKEKLDLIVLYKQLNLLNIMFEHGSFIQMPSLGDSSNQIRVQSNNAVSITETINDIYSICNDYYKVLINCGNKFDDQFLMTVMAKFALLIKQNPYGIELTGCSKDIKEFLSLINCNNVNYKISLLIEIGNSHKDFISGKKNGKILKILNQYNQERSVVKFLPLNEYNFLFNLVIEKSINLTNFLGIIDLIEKELPCEAMFNIPEIFHKSIIGNGGLIIQSIMKKYNVYIKFLNQNNSLNQVNVYSFKRFNNVLIKCPNKNADNIKLVKNELSNLVVNCCNNNLNNNYLSKNLNNSIYNSINFRLLLSHYLLLINNFKLNQLNNLEIEFQSSIDWPFNYQEFNGNNDKYISIKGSDIKLKYFINNLMAMLPQNYKFILTLNPRFYRLLNSEEFVDQIITPFKIFYDIELLCMEINGSQELWLSYFDNTHLSIAVERLTNFLRSNQYMIIDKLPFTFNPIEGFDIDSIKCVNNGHQSNSPEKNKRTPRQHPPLTRITNAI